MTTPNLKPCPFCGTEPDWKRWEINSIWQIKIFCDGAGCHVHPSVFGNEKAMTEIWNTRNATNEQWQPIETAPKDGTPILLGCFDAGNSWCGSDLWHINRWLNYSKSRPTHWMPLPPPPAIEKVNP